MKKTMSFMLILLLSISLFSCGKSSETKEGSSNKNQEESKVENKQEKVKEPISYDYPTDENHIDFFTQNDTFETMASSTPYYMGAQSLDLPAFQEYDNLKKKKIEESKKNSDETFKSAKELKNKLEPFKTAFIEFAGIISQEDPASQGFATEAGTEIIGYTTKEEGFIAQIESIDTLEIKNSFAKANFDYQKTLLSTQLAKTTIEDFSYLFSSSAVLAEIYENTENQNISDALKSFEDNMSKVENLNSDFDKLSENLLNLHISLKQIEAGDYYFTKASILAIQEKLPEIKELASALETKEDGLSAEDIEMVKAYVNLFEEFSEELDTTNTNFENNPLITNEESKSEEVSFSDFFIKKAYAVIAPRTNEAFLMANKKISTPPSNEKSTIGKIGGALSTAASWTWSGVKTVVKKTQTAAGVTLDTANAVTKTGFDMMFGVANGNSAKEIGNEIIGNFKKIKENYDQDKSGSETLKTAGEYMEAFENAPKQGLEYVVGKGWTSWAVGGVSKITLGMFTGLAKGIYKVGNKQSTPGEYVEGVLDIGLSLIGGSKVIFKGAGGGAKEGVRAVAKKAINYLKMMGQKLDIQQLRGITKEILKKAKLNPKEVLSLISNSLEIEGKQAVVAQLKVLNQELDKKFLDLIKNGMKEILKNAKNTPGTMAGNYKDFVKEAFENSLKGYKEAILKTLGEGFEDYVDNLVSSKMDDWIKAALKVYIDTMQFDGVYTLNQVITEELSIPIKVTVSKGIVSGGIDYSLSREGWTASLKIDTNGSVNEKGEVSGDITGNLSASGPSSTFDLFGKTENSRDCTDNLKATLNGKFKGSVNETSLKMTTTSGTVNPSGTFFCEPITSGPQPIEDAQEVVLNKEI